MASKDFYAVDLAIETTDSSLLRLLEDAKASGDPVCLELDGLYVSSIGARGEEYRSAVEKGEPVRVFFRRTFQAGSLEGLAVRMKGSLAGRVSAVPKAEDLDDLPDVIGSPEAFKNAMDAWGVARSELWSLSRAVYEYLVFGPSKGTFGRWRSRLVEALNKCGAEDFKGRCRE